MVVQSDELRPIAALSTTTGLQGRQEDGGNVRVRKKTGGYMPRLASSFSRSMCTRSAFLRT
jgi:hypothetical protein